MEEKSRNRLTGWRLWALFACGAVFLASGALLVRDLARSAREDAANQVLVEEVREVREAVKRKPAALPPSTQPSQPEEAPVQPELPKYAENGHLIQYDALWKQNNDLAGWLYIEGTKLDYPVMYTPEDPEYYLHRGFYRDYAASGCLFIGPGSTPEGSHAVVYGHHMKNGTMFGSLDQYQKESYYRDHPVIHFDTLTEEGSYEVLGVFYSRVYTDADEGVFRYYKYTDLAGEDAFNDYVRQVKAASLYDTGVEAVYGDRLLTLSTCSYHTENGRFVVVARQSVPA